MQKRNSDYNGFILGKGEIVMKHIRIISLLLTLLLVISVLPTGIAAEPEAIWGKSPIAEPYDYVSTGSFSGDEQP